MLTLASCWAGCSHWKSASQTRAADRFRLGPSFKGTPPEALRRVSLEIDFSGQCGGAISALAVDQGCLCGPETRIRAWKSSADAVLQGRTTHTNQCIHIFWFKVARYFLADSCFNSPSKPCISSAQSKIRWVSAKSFAQFSKVNQHWIILFHRDYQLDSLEWGGTCLVEPPTIQGREIGRASCRERVCQYV